jgi:hypothetical protein
VFTGEVDGEATDRAWGCRPVISQNNFKKYWYLTHITLVLVHHSKYLEVPYCFYHNTLFENNKNKKIWYLAHTNLVLVHHLKYLSIGTSLFLTIRSR